MLGIANTRGGIVEAVAAARDEALVEIGREAAARQEMRTAKVRRARAGKFAVAVAAAGAAIAAGAVVYRAQVRRKGKPVAEVDGHRIPVNGTAAEEVDDHEDEPLMSKR